MAFTTNNPTAWHEAAHAVVALKLGVEVEYVTLGRYPNAEDGPHCAIAGSRGIEADLAVTLAARVAAGMGGPGESLGAYSQDMEKATARAGGDAGLIGRATSLAFKVLDENWEMVEDIAGWLACNRTVDADRLKMIMETHERAGRAVGAAR